MKTLHPEFTHGTIRLVPPERTLHRLVPHLHSFGITRLAALTRLDLDLGVPVYAAIRPRGLVFAGSHGKGLTTMAAKVSALMEAIEFHHAENPDPSRLKETSASELSRCGERSLGPRQLRATFSGYDDPDYRFQWTQADCLSRGGTIWLPAGAGYFIERPIVTPHSNGLASGNHLIEASLHGLFELIERDAVSRMTDGKQLLIEELAKVMDWDTIDDCDLQNIYQRIREADSDLVLMWIPSVIDVHTFWAVLLNKSPFAPVTTLNVGYGTHVRADIAAKRAVTEAIQSRVTMVHAAREDIVDMPVFGSQSGRHGKAFQYFKQLKGTTSWHQIESMYPTWPDCLQQCFERTLQKLMPAVQGGVYRIDLTSPAFEIPVVKMVVPGLQFNRLLF